MKASLLLRALLIGGFLAMQVLQPGPARAAPLAHDPVFTASLMSAPPSSICPGDQVALTIFIFDKAHAIPAAGYPVNVVHDPNIGELTPTSKVVTNGTVNFVYKAHDNSLPGPKTDLLKFGTGGFPTGLQVPIQVADCSEYKFSFLLELRKTDNNMELYEYFSGESTATRISGQLTGTETGSSEVFLNMGGDAGPIVCSLDPPIQGSGVFNTDGTVQSQAPGQDLLTVGFTFQRIPLNNATLSCRGPNAVGSFPFNVGGWDPNETALEGLEVPMVNNTGSIPISHEQMTGTLTVWREKK